MPTVHPRQVLFAGHELLTPNQGGVAKDPQILVSRMLGMESVERGRGHGNIVHHAALEGAVSES